MFKQEPEYDEVDADDMKLQGYRENLQSDVEIMEQISIDSDSDGTEGHSDNDGAIDEPKYIQANHKTKATTSKSFFKDTGRDKNSNSDIDGDETKSNQVLRQTTEDGERDKNSKNDNHETKAYKSNHKNEADFSNQVPPRPVPPSAKLIPSFINP